MSATRTISIASALAPRFLLDSDRADEVLELRRAYQDAMSSDYVAVVEHLTERTVVAFMSANHVDPDLAAEVFVLAPEATERA